MSLLESSRTLCAWLQRARSLVPAIDAVELFSPPILVEKFAKYALGGRKRRVPADDPDARDPELVRLVLDLVRELAHGYFRLRIEGVENVAASGPVLLVGNHNGALLPTDGLFTLLAIAEKLGTGRAVFALAHDFLFHDPLLRRYALRLGALRAGHESARRVLQRGGVVLVYPGSDLDAFRPWAQRDRVVLGGRKGFLRLAIELGVPIVPVVSAGTHEQLIVLSRGDKLAKLLHTHTWARTIVFPLVFSIPWGITSGFVPYLPLPAQTTIAFGAPMRWPTLTPDDAADPATLRRCYAEVETKMQSMLDELYRGRRPFLGRRSHAAAVWSFA